jgi:Xaa-Pro aminopeptidase
VKKGSLATRRALNIRLQTRNYAQRYGQPHPFTHPHLLKPGEGTWFRAKIFKFYPFIVLIRYLHCYLVTPLTTAEEYAERRQRLAAKLPPNSLAIFPAALHCYMTNDIPYVYRQNSDFLWLSGFHEPSSVLVIDNLEGAGTCHSTLFVAARDPAREIWDGPRTGVERAPDFLGIKDVHSSQLADIDRVLSPKLRRAQSVFFNDVRSDVDLHDFLLEKAVSHPPSPRPFVEELRVIKSPSEQNLMRKSTAISGESFGELMKYTRPGMSQRQLDAVFEMNCRIRGSQRLAYPPVFASGVNNLTLHYIANDEIVQDGQLLLVDAGGEYNCYASDITRTFPASGKFSEAQAELYSAVLRVQKAIIQSLNVSSSQVSLNSLHEQSVRLLVRELVNLKILTPSTVNTYQKYYPHSIGHWLGMDVHDTMSVSGHTPLRPGMIVTVEPGLYIPVDDPAVPERFRGIGIRIEDDVLITASEPEVLTRLAPKEISEIESISASGR